jgi:hypothetical protein
MLRAQYFHHTLDTRGIGPKGVEQMVVLGSSGKHQFTSRQPSAAMSPGPFGRSTLLTNRCSICRQYAKRLKRAGVQACCLPGGIRGGRALAAR